MDRDLSRPSNLASRYQFRPWAFRTARDRIYREFAAAKCLSLPQPVEPNLRVDQEELGRCLNLLSQSHREVLMLRYFEDMSYEEISRVTGCGLGTVRSRLHRAKHMLRAAVEQTLYEYKQQ